MKLKIEIESENAAFGPDAQGQMVEAINATMRACQRIGEQCAGIEPGIVHSGPVLDINGNRVGFWEVETHEAEGEA